MRQSLGERQNSCGTFFKVVGIVSTTLLAVGCGGGSGSSGGSSGGSGEPLLVEASVSSDTCGERLSDVRQVFRLSGTQLDTSLVTLSLSEANGALTGGFSESNGSCTRTYEVTMTEGGGGNYDVSLGATSNCGGSTCETTWTGTAAPTSEKIAQELQADPSDALKISGERCNPDVPTTVGYRPSLFECNGNSAVLFRDNLRNNFSVVVRRNGQYNDRDPNNTSCGTNRCSPYKTQKRMELPEYQVNCLGASGFSDYFAVVNRISVKFSAAVSDSNDTSQFEQYCLRNTRGELN